MLTGHLTDCGPCPYLPDRRFTAFVPGVELSGPLYRRLMDAGFRRSGTVAYLPHCQDCTACRPIRCDVTTFEPRTDQRRNARRNGDLIISVVQKGCDSERNDLYRRYQREVHDDDSANGCEDLGREGNIPGCELHARDASGRLLAVSSVDVLEDALSSVYCYYDPDERRRGLGTFMVLAEIEFARQLGLRWLYLGLLVTGCRKMAYKARFGPAEVLSLDRWVRHETP